MPNNISRYTVKDGKIMNQLTKDFRSMGYQVITFGNKVRELQRGNHTVVIAKEK